MGAQDNPRLTSEISSLLANTESAHGRYEAEVLKGIRDEDWPKWYADYLLAHGLLDLFPTPAAAAQIGEHLDELLAEADTLHRANAPDERWQDYYARFLAGKA